MEWIKITDQLPSHNEIVIIFTEEDYWIQVVFCNNEWKTSFSNDSGNEWTIEDVTHWFQPSPPKE